MIEKICNHYKVSVEEVLSQSRTRQVLKTRSILLAVLRRQGLSYQDIGAMFSRHHSSIIHSVRWSEARYSKEIDLFEPNRAVLPKGGGYNKGRVRPEPLIKPKPEPKVVIKLSPYEHLIDEPVNQGKSYSQYLKDEKELLYAKRFGIL